MVPSNLYPPSYTTGSSRSSSSASRDLEQDTYTVNKNGVIERKGKDYGVKLEVRRSSIRGLSSYRITTSLVKYRFDEYKEKRISMKTG